MCPIRVHWHVKQNYKEYWRVKITITNFNYRLNYTQWNLVAQHPNLDNITQIFSFNYKSLTPYAGLSKRTHTHTHTKPLSSLFFSAYLKDLTFWIVLQMIRRCYGEWSSTTISYQKQGLLGMFNQRFCSVKINQPSHSRKVGLFLVGFTSMETIASCLLLTLTLFFPTVVSGHNSHSSPPYSSLFWSSSSSLLNHRFTVLPLVWLGFLRWSGINFIYDSFVSYKL